MYISSSSTECKGIQKSSDFVLPTRDGKAVIKLMKWLAANADVETALLVYVSLKCKTAVWHFLTATRIHSHPSVNAARNGARRTARKTRRLAMWILSDAGHQLPGYESPTQPQATEKHRNTCGIGDHKTLRRMSRRAFCFYSRRTPYIHPLAQNAGGCLGAQMAAEVWDRFTVQ